MKASRKIILSILMVTLLSLMLVTPALAGSHVYSSYMDGYNIVQNINCFSTSGEDGTWYGTTASLRSELWLYGKDSGGDIDAHRFLTATTYNLDCSITKPSNWTSVTNDTGYSEIVHNGYVYSHYMYAKP